MLQVREEVYFTKGRIIVRGKLVTCGKAKKAALVAKTQEPSQRPELSVQNKNGG
jgi:hypothetical protein